ncbi:transcriptional regulator [Burkholderia sp. SRS-46]|nr:transcriptional regulator [Burkholderia sp. SRS-46]
MIQIGTLSVDFAQRDIRRHGAPLRVGARAFDILEVLHRADGRVVSKDDIMDAVWPGVIIEENCLQVHVAALRRLLGDHRGLIKTVPGRGYMLVAGAHPGAPATRPADAPLPGDGPRPSFAPLIGRQAEIGQIIDLLDRMPVVTLVGAGGIGKTSLAAQVARDLRRRARDTVYWVELARAATHDDVLCALAAALDLAGHGEPDLDGIANAIAASRCLIVLDNAEHVVDVIASLVETLAARTDALHMLVTSREPLHVPAERVLRVAPLAVPSSGARADEIAGCSAVQLFLCRVRATAGCAPDEVGLRLAGDICRRLEGLPLAIELAAARVATLGIEGVASRLDDRLNLLTGGLRAALPRHQALRATFDWSHALLSPAARALFRRLGCFIGPFTFDAVGAVAAVFGTPVDETIGALGELVAKSLLSVEFRSAHAQYWLTESTRAYALEKLRNEGEFARVATRCARYAREQAGAMAAMPAGLKSASASGPVSAPVWQPAGTHAGELAAGVATLPIVTLTQVSEFGTRGDIPLHAACATTSPHPDDDTSWNRMLELPELPPHVGNDAFEKRALAGQWNTKLAIGDIHESLRYATRFARAAERCGTRAQRWLAASMVATSLHCFGEHAQARERLEAAMSAFGDADEPAGSGSSAATLSQATLAQLAWIQGEPEHAMQLVAHAVERARQHANEPRLCVVLGAIAVPLALQYGDHDAALGYLAALRSEAERRRFGIWLLHAECLQAQFESQTGYPGAGLVRLAPALQRLEASGFRRRLAPATVVLAEELARAGRASEACAKLDAMLASCRARGEHLFVPELLRAKGLAMLEQANDADADLAGAQEEDARRHLLDAMRVARGQGAGMWELRAALDLADHLLERGHDAQVASLVASLAGRFDLRSRASDVRRLARLHACAGDGGAQPAHPPHARREAAALHDDTA